MYVFSYSIEQARSEFRAWGIIVAFGGLVYIDRKSFQVMRITHVLSGMPPSLPATAVSEDLDYGFAEIGWQTSYFRCLRN